MVKNAQAHAGEDKRKREQIDARNSADRLVYETEKNLQEYGDKIDPGTRANVEAATGRVKEALKGDNADEIKSATEALTQIWQKAAATMYQQASAQQGPQAGSAQSGPQQTGTPEDSQDQEKTVDADFEVVE
jgi:molecular chaperone DnaK